MATIAAPSREEVRSRLAAVRRLVCMSSLGVGESRRLGNLTVKFVTHWVLRHVLVDKAAQESLIRASELDWTILRPPRILETDTTGTLQRWQATLDGARPRWQISRRDAAAEMLNLLADDSAIHQTWHVSY